MDIRKSGVIPDQKFEQCHDGAGTLICKSLLDGLDSTKFPFMHHDRIPAGVSIGLHLHKENEEIYYLLSGRGTLTCDENEYEMLPGDISLCHIGHSHAFLALEDSELIVVGSR